MSESRAGVEQVVLLGAGYDSRPFRFQDALADVRVFEVDHPGTQARKRRMLERVDEASPANLSYIPVDFNQQSLQEALAESRLLAADKKTLFLWEGVSYYLPQQVVEGVLDFVSGCAAGSSIVFDYATRGFVNGDIGTYGGKQVARWLKKIREPFLFGLDPEETKEFLRGRKLHIVSDLGPQELEQSYLRTKDGRCLGRDVRSRPHGACESHRLDVIGPEITDVALRSAKCERLSRQLLPSTLVRRIEVPIISRRIRLGTQIQKAALKS